MCAGIELTIEVSANDTPSEIELKEFSHNDDQIKYFEILRKSIT